MPLRMNIPLPGPFSYSRRIGGNSRSNSPGLMSILFIWSWLAPLWLVWLMFKYMFLGAKYLVNLAR